ncbi:MAG: hypothetical protein ABW221_12635 [Vicinamibacteria bacterium]
MSAFVLLVSMAVVAAEGSVVRVPRGAAPVIDGAIGAAEWQDAAVRKTSDGTTVRFRHDERHLFVGLSSTQPGFASVCAAHGADVRVFHASAALGLVTYARGTDGWTTSDKEFVYGMRATALTDEARSERARYLAAHGWLASTMNMGDGRTQEMQIALDLLGKTPHLAVARFVIEGDGGSIAAWPETMAKDDGCRAPDLVRGNVPAPLRFEPERWIALDLEP